MVFRGLVLASVLWIGVDLCPVQAGDIEAASGITAVTVYLDRAEVTRTATVEVPAGAHQVIFRDLPANLDPDSLRVSGMAGAAVSMGAITHRLDSHRDVLQTRERDLRAARQDLLDRRALHELELQSLEGGRAFLDGLGRQAALRSDEAIAELDLQPDLWGSVADTLMGKLGEILKAAHAQQVHIREIDEQMQTLDEELAQLGTNEKRSYRVGIPVDASAAAALQVALRYQVSDAGWRPAYDARMEEESGALALVQHGMVRQRTGEDWSDIRLTLSTAQPHRGTGLPALTTRWVGILEPTAATAGMDFMGFAAPDDYALFEQAAQPAPLFELGLTDASIQTSGVVGEYRVTGPITVASDGTQSKVRIGEFATETVRQVQIKPQLSTDSYLVMRATLIGEAPILPGPASLFRDGVYIGESRLPMMRPGDVVELPFGADDLVTVRRQVLKDERSQAGLISRDAVMERHTVTEIRNLHASPVEVALLEALPVPRDARIRIDILRDETTAGYERDVDDVKGVMRWVQVLAPAAESRIRLAWRATWPADTDVYGLDFISGNPHITYPTR